jgi:hypothetical protein
MAAAFPVEHYKSVIPFEKHAQELVRPLVDSTVMFRMREAVELDGTDSESSGSAHQFLNRELRILVGC